MSTLPATDVPGVLARVKLLEECGFDSVGFPDTQAIYPDPFVSMGAAAASGSPLRLMTAVSNPVTRHPSVTATAIGGVAQIARGGAALVVSAGDTSLLNIGRRPAPLADVRAFVAAVLDLQRTCAARFKGDEIRFLTPPARVPVHLAAHGPKSLELAGELCDGAWIGTGIVPEVLDDAFARIEAGAARAGRSVTALERGVYVRCFLGDVDEAKQVLSPSLAAVGHYALARAPEGKGIPAALLPAFRALADGYDPVTHAAGGAELPNARLIRELGLLDYLAERFALIGTSEQVASSLRRMAARGIDSFMVFFRGPAADDQMRRFGREVIPEVRRAGVE